jgi:hypothetical protein
MAGIKQRKLPDVELQDEIECRSCARPTNGSAICRLCFAAVTELRALASDHDAATRPSPARTKARALAGSRRARS